MLIHRAGSGAAFGTSPRGGEIKEVVAFDRDIYIEKQRESIKAAQNLIKIIVKKIIMTDSSLIMNEATKALMMFSKREDVIHKLWKDGLLFEILDKQFISIADPQSQENFLRTLAEVCKYPQYRNELVHRDDLIDILITQIKSMSPRVTL